ncbi:MAG: hypothetical protein AAF546_04845 [Verrucomicrobiota bacterium]
MTLIREGIITAVLLILIGVGGYFLGGRVSVTALIPAFFGIPILISALIAIKNLKLGMHAAATFGLLGFIAPLGRIIPSVAKGSFELNLATGSQILMVLICGVFVVLCVKSFIDVRKARKNAEA